MSKSNKRPSNSAKAAPPASKQSWLFWAGLAIVGVLAVVALLAWQGSKGAESGAANAERTPNLQVDQTNIDFGDVPMSQLVKASFKLSNTGDGTLNIVAPPVPEVVEGC